MATADDLYHIVFNLIENAVKYNVPDGSVHVTAEADETSVRLTVEDTGIGIPEADRLNIFSRFYRVDKARSREAGGSGLGLSIVHDAVLAHGGSITVGANKPQGSVFIVTFPRPTSEETGI
jgi:signal transduction histidine kinase